MRVIALSILLVFVLALAVVVGDAQQQLSGAFGRSLLQSMEEERGDRMNETQASGLWSWGSVPKWHMLIGGKLEYMGVGMWFYPAFPSNNTPIIENASLTAKNAPDFASPEMLNDPWMIAQVSGRPVLFRSLIL